MRIFIAWLVVVYGFFHGSEITAMYAVENGDLEVMLNFFADCTSIEIDKDCLITSLIQDLSNDGSSFLPHYNNSCGPDLVDINQLTMTFQKAWEVCVAAGFNITTAHFEESKATIMQLLSVETCWNRYCQEVPSVPEGPFVGDVVKHLETITLNKVLPCVGASLDLNSCLVNKSMGSILEIVIDSLDATGRNVSTTFFSKDGVREECFVPHINGREIQDIVLRSQEICTLDGDFENSGFYIDDITSQLIALFLPTPCWCPRPYNQTSPNFLETLYFEHVMNCADVTVNTSSCAESISFERLLGQINNVAYSGNGILVTRKLTPELPVMDRASCSSPQASAFELRRAVDDSVHVCEDAGYVVPYQESERAYEKLKNLFNSSSCWLSRCDEKTFLYLTSNWLQSCTNVKLPIAMTNPSLFNENTESYVKDSILACMIDFVMTQTPSSFGLVDTFETREDVCLPPGHSQMRDLCPTILGPMAFSHCVPESDPDNTNDDFTINLSYRYSYEYTFSYLDNGGFGYNPATRYPSGPNGSGGQDDKGELIDDLCVILEAWTSDKGKDCLLMICEGNADDGSGDLGSTKSRSPSTLQPSLINSLTPSMTPLSRKPSPISTMYPQYTDITTKRPTSMPTQDELKEQRNQSTRAPTNISTLTKKPAIALSKTPSDAAFQTQSPRSTPSQIPTRESADVLVTKHPLNPPTFLPMKPAPVTKIPTITPSRTPSEVIFRTKSPTITTPSNIPKVLETKVPALKPSNLPTRKIGTNMNATNIPTRRPTKIPSRAIRLPTISPTVKPVPAVTRRPTIIYPTSAPLPYPVGKGVVEVTLQAVVTINNLNASQVPSSGPELDSMVRVLERAIDQTLPPGAKSRILRIGSMSIYERKLSESSEGLIVDFEVTIRHTCEDSDCSESNVASVVDEMYDGVTASLKDAVTSGEVARIIKEEATNQGVEFLKEVTMKSDSFVATKTMVKVEKGAPVPETSLAVQSSCLLGATVAVLFVSSFLLSSCIK